MQPSTKSPKRLLVLGTANRKKGQEMAELLAPAGLKLKTLADFPDALDVVEDGDSFAANATVKAIGQANHLKHWVLAEDSGLEVRALDGAPGIFSARYSGPGATDDSNIQKLLAELGTIPVEKRSARYVCHLTLCDPVGRIRAEAEAYCSGRIVQAPCGTHGFGYDPVFEIVEYHQTLGHLGPVVKACLSHRARAVRKLIPKLVELADSDEWK